MKKGYPLVLNCHVMGGRKGKARMTWSKNGRHIRHGLRHRRVKLMGPFKGVLQIRRADSIDVGLYSCKAFNKFSHDQLDFNVRVISKFL